MDNPEKTKRTFKNGQSRENQKDIQEWTIQRKPKGHSRMDNPEKTRRTFKNGQSRYTGNIGHTKIRDKEKQTQHNTELKTIKN